MAILFPCLANIFKVTEIKKHMKNSYAKTAGLLACLLQGIFRICMFWLTQHVCSITSQIRLEHSKSTWRLDNIFVCFILIKTNNNIRQLSPLWQPWRNLAKMCRFFAFSRIFLLIYEAWYFFAQNSISVTWKHYPMREFDWMVTLTVAFFDGVSRRLSVFMRS